MFLNLSKKISLAILACLVAAVSVFTVSCQKELSGDGFTVTETPPDLTSKISSTVSGFVTDETDAAVNGATVQLGASSTTTDKYGYFEFSNTEVVKNAAVVTVIKSGYFKGIKTYIATAGKTAFFRIKLLPKNTAGTFDAAAGGTVTLPNGLSIVFPAGAIVLAAATNTAYTGQVSVAAQWINPTAADRDRVMPGDLRGLDSLGFIRSLTTYGMAAVELTGGSGELLQLGNSKKATITFPIPASILASAPANLPLWSFNETNGLWKQEGRAVKSGSNYVGEVSHFSFWNCDVPANYIHFDCTIKDAGNNAVAGALVKLTEVSNPQNYRYGYTDSSGYVGGLVPSNAQVLMEVFSNYSCSNNAYSQTFTTTNASLSLGNVSIPSTSTAVVSGNIIDCSAAAVTNGYVLMIKDGINYRYPASSAGTFSFSTTLCSSSADIFLVPVDDGALQEGNSTSLTINAGNNAAGTLTACGTVIEQFVNYTINGTAYSLTAPGDTFNHFINTQMNPPLASIYGYRFTGGSIANSVGILFTQTGIALNSTQPLYSFTSMQIPDSNITIPNPINVTITEYGAVGQFIAGNFAGALVSGPPANTPYNITCQFRVRRSQ